MKRKGIPTSVHYPSLLCDQEALNNVNSTSKSLLNNIFSKKIYQSYEINNAKDITKKVLSLPMHPLLSEDDQNLVINSLLESIN